MGHLLSHAGSRDDLRTPHCARGHCPHDGGLDEPVDHSSRVEVHEELTSRNAAVTRTGSAAWLWGSTCSPSAGPPSEYAVSECWDRSRPVISSSAVTRRPSSA